MINANTSAIVFVDPRLTIREPAWFLESILSPSRIKIEEMRILDYCRNRMPVISGNQKPISIPDNENRVESLFILKSKRLLNHLGGGEAHED
jgi:hypothetical protein